MAIQYPRCLGNNRRGTLSVTSQKIRFLEFMEQASAELMPYQSPKNGVTAEEFT